MSTYLFIFLIILLILISINSSNSTYVSIPFKVKNFTYGDGKDLIHKYIYKDILVTFLVGEPPQEVNISACLGEYSTFIIANDAYGYMDSTFDKTKSKTYKQYAEPEQFYYQTYREGIKSTDHFYIQSTQTNISNLKFNLATEIQDGSLFCYYCEILTEPGMLGLLIGQTKMNEENVYDLNFIGNLKNRSFISSYDFFFDFEDNDKGNIIIGTTPHEYYGIEKYNGKEFKPVKTSLSNKDLEWAVELGNVYYGNKKLIVIPDKPMLLRIEFGLILGYQEWEYVLDDEFFTDLITEGKCSKRNGTGHDPGYRYRYYICNKDTDLSKFNNFTINIKGYENNFSLTKDDLFLDEGDKYVFLLAFGGMSEFVLGLPFLKKNQIVFNQDSKTIGFYINAKEPENNNLTKYIIIISVLSAVLIAIIIVIIWYVLKKKKSKVKATELLDDKDTPFTEESRNTESVNNQKEKNNHESKIINE